jgi:hypothetical protein
VTLKDVWVHHFCGVRSDPEDVFRKFARSSIGDDSETLIDQAWWRRAKWDRLPRCRNFHPFRDREEAWAGIQICRRRDLPTAVQNHPLVEQGFRDLQATPAPREFAQGV